MGAMRTSDCLIWEGEWHKCGVHAKDGESAQMDTSYEARSEKSEQNVCMGGVGGRLQERKHQAPVRAF